MNRLKRFLSGLLAVSMMGTVLLSSSVVFAEEETETEMMSETSESDSDGFDLSDFEWTEDMVLTFTNGENTYQIYNDGFDLYLSKIVDGEVTNGSLFISSEMEGYDVLCECVNYFFLFIPYVYESKGIW